MLYLPTLSSNPKVKVYAKLEFMNPSGGIKDRLGIYIAQKMMMDALITPDMTLIEATAGNTGLGLALGFIQTGIKMIFVIPEKFSLEKQTLLKAMGATIITTPESLGMEGAQAKVETLLKEISNSFTIDQFNNTNNPQAHYHTTAPEIVADMEGEIHTFLMGAGSGGTFSGIAHYLKEQDPSIQTVLVDPIGSTLGGGIEQAYGIEGIGNHIIPKTMAMDLVDDVIKVSDDEALQYVRHLAKHYGLFVGSSSGANLAAAAKKAALMEEGNIVTLLLDRGERYFSKHIMEETQ